MTTQGSLVLSLIGIAYLLWIVNLTRKGKLYVGYSVIWVVWIILGILVVGIPPLLDLVTDVTGALFPASALSVLAFGLIFAMQIYLLSQLSILSHRIASIAQHIAITEAQQHAQNRSPSDGN